MKKLFVLSLLVATISMAQAQCGFSSLKHGIRAGANYATITGLDNSFEARPDFHVGLYASMNLTKNYAIQPEFNYSRQGVNSQNANIENIRLDYLSMGLSNKLYLAKGLHLLISPALDFQVGNGHSDDGLSLNPFKDKELDISMTGGLGYELPFGLVVDVRYKRGLLDQDNFDQYKAEGAAGGSYNQVFQVGIGYQFGLPSGPDCAAKCGASSGCSKKKS